MPESSRNANGDPCPPSACEEVHFIRNGRPEAVIHLPTDNLYPEFVSIKMVTGEERASFRSRHRVDGIVFGKGPHQRKPGDRFIDVIARPRSIGQPPPTFLLHARDFPGVRDCTPSLLCFMPAETERT
ncbi:MAG: hypothetical protein V2G42_08355 [bacterium JZ-2024 1]